MGGKGSSRWNKYRRKTTVESCRYLDTNLLTRARILRLNRHSQGRWAWKDASTGAENMAVNYEVNTTNMASAWVRLSYTCTASQEEVAYRIQLATTQPPGFGGVRWLFVCALSVSGSVCRRRVRKLYLPPGARYFGCRNCYQLVYLSSQTSGKEGAKD